jgi:hypothetical protein
MNQLEQLKYIYNQFINTSGIEISDDYSGSDEDWLFYHSVIGHINNKYYSICFKLLKKDEEYEIEIAENVTDCLNEIETIITDIKGTIKNQKSCNFILHKWYKTKPFNTIFYFKPHSEKHKDGKIYSIEGDVFAIAGPRSKPFKADSSISNSLFFEAAVLLDDLSEIQDHLPIGHVDKIKKKQSIVKWQPGTWVTFTNKYGNLITVGDVVQLESGPYDIDGNCVNVSKWAKRPCLPFKRYCKWFATEQEAKEYSNEILTPLDLKIGNTYRTFDSDNQFWMIFKPLKIIDKNYCMGEFITEEKAYNPNGELCYRDSTRNFKPATEHELKWLNKCISDGNYLTNKEAILGFTKSNNIKVSTQEIKTPTKLKVFIPKKQTVKITHKITKLKINKLNKINYVKQQDVIRIVSSSNCW